MWAESWLLTCTFHILALFIVLGTVAREYGPLDIQNTVHFAKEVYLCVSNAIDINYFPNWHYHMVICKVHEFCVLLGMF